MTLDELQAELARRRRAGLDALVLVLPRACNGRRARVLPGLTGEVMCVNCDGHTVVRVELDAVERMLAKHGVRA